MTFEEANLACEKLNELQKRYWVGSKSERESIKGEWNLTCLSIKMGGFKLKHRSIKDDFGNRLGTLWFVDIPADNPKRKRNMHTECFKYVNVRPEGVKTLKGDCVIRCVCYCLKMKYQTVLYRQRKYAKSVGTVFNDDDIWDKQLKDKGWKRVYFSKKLVRYEFARLTSGLKHPIATSSCEHVCVTHNGKVVDIWESQNGRIDYVVVHPDEFEKVKSIVTKFG